MGISVPAWLSLKASNYEKPKIPVVRACRASIESLVGRDRKLVKLLSSLKHFTFGFLSFLSLSLSLSLVLSKFHFSILSFCFLSFLFFLSGFDASSSLSVFIVSVDFYALTGNIVARDMFKM